MLKTQPGKIDAKYYAARVLASVPGSKNLELCWFQGNIYENDEKPVSERLSLSIGDVWDAYNDIFIQEDLASIKWPIALYHDAHDVFGYTNTVITQALEEAQASIIEIVTNSTGEHQHPVLADFKDWIGKSHKKLANSFQYDYFTYDLLPADQSPSAETAVLLSNHLPTSSLDFNLGASDDAQIYYLAQNFNESELKAFGPLSPEHGYLQRHLSLPESALAASQGSQDTRIPPVYINLDNIHAFPSSKCIQSLEDVVLFESGAQAVTAHCADGSPYVWGPGQSSVFTLAGRDLITSSTPPSKALPVLLPEAPMKTKNMKMDINRDSTPTPSHTYSLHLIPSHTSQFHNAPSLVLGKHLLEKDSDDSWDSPDLVANLKHKRKRTNQQNDDFEDILETAGVAQSHQLENKHMNQTQGTLKMGKSK
ncbi:hypothetical protein GYMLUDRAFT_250366 [Collybiopsis luxurians FD-317 M1]|uniref:Uncharacterized protein n=1 Tax=Collybiopsis luxurians FD-317 M1 TaxID=944289 RepID=A0A0D0BV02_9AGAR|nr:hypothetical protein GYMLUDRAFT_250366 [Collybiopsis luxurians FD-317 M1]